MGPRQDWHNGHLTPALFLQRCFHRHITEILCEEIRANEQENEISLPEMGLHRLFHITARRDLKPLHVSFPLPQAQVGLQFAVK